MRALPRLLVFVLILASLPSCSDHREPAPRDLRGVDTKLSTFAFMEEGNLVSFIVGTRATQYRDEAGYMPLEICIANRGVREISLTRESFTLVDSEGNRHACVGPRELLEKYEFLDLDLRLTELSDIVFNRFAAFTRYPSKFSPNRAISPNPAASSIVRDSVVIPKFGYIIDMIYFPVPKTGLHNQRFELFMQAPELPEPVFVKFLVL
jgi:hypothetical protein